MKVLVIEDSERLQRSLKHGLSRSGFAVDVVGDGEDGLAYARHGKYDVIILDLLLPFRVFDHRTRGRDEGHQAWQRVRGAGQQPPG